MLLGGDHTSTLWHFSCPVESTVIQAYLQFNFAFSSWTWTVNWIRSGRWLVPAINRFFPQLTRALEMALLRSAFRLYCCWHWELDKILRFGGSAGSWAGVDIRSAGHHWMLNLLNKLSFRRISKLFIVYSDHHFTIARLNWLFSIPIIIWTVLLVIIGLEEIENSKKTRNGVKN